MFPLDKRRTLACAAAALLAACSPPPETNAADNEAAAPAAPAANVAAPQPAPADREELSIIVRGDGLLVETPGHGQPLGFGETTPAQAEAALASLGAPRRSSNGECPAGPLDFMDWDNGLQLTFQDGKLQGWWIDEKSRGIATAAGLRPGSPRSAIGTAKVEDTTVGKMFTIDEVYGFLDEEKASRVTALYGGVACIFH
jgi:hypothetical protein